MSCFYDNVKGRWLVRYRDMAGRNCCITCNKKNLASYGLDPYSKLTERTAKRLEQAVLSKVVGPDGVPTSRPVRLTWFQAVARYLPVDLDADGKDKWKFRPNEPLVNTSTYSRSQVYRMRMVLTSLFAGFLNRGSLTWRKMGTSHRTEEVAACEVPLEHVSHEHLGSFMNLMREEIANNFTLRGYMLAVNTFLGWCYERGYIRQNPTQGIKLPSGKKSTTAWLERKQVDELLKAVQKTPLELPVRLILYLGCRREEAVTLEWQDVDFQKNIVHVRGTKTAGSNRLVPLADSLSRLLKTIVRSSEHSRIILNTDDRPCTGEGLDSLRTRFLEEKKTPFRWSFKMLRATFGSLLIQKGVSIEHVSLALGHSDIKVTQQWYIGLTSRHVLPEVASGLAKALPR